MSNDEGCSNDKGIQGRRSDVQATVRHLGFVIASSFVIGISSLILPPPGIGYRGKALAKFCLLALCVHLLVRLACLLLGTGT
jgi:hypothetical protein